MLIQFYIEEALEVPSYLLCNINNSHVLNFGYSLNYCTYE